MSRDFIDYKNAIWSILPTWQMFLFYAGHSLVRLGFICGILTIEGHLIPNAFYIYIEYMISKHILKITFLNKPEFRYFLLAHS